MRGLGNVCLRWVSEGSGFMVVRFRVVMIQGLRVWAFRVYGF